jgi:chaperonin GroEL
MCLRWRWLLLRVRHRASDMPRRDPARWYGFLIFPGFDEIRRKSGDRIVPGGGVALLRAGRALAGMDVAGDERTGVNIILRACEEPCARSAETPVLRVRSSWKRSSERRIQLRFERSAGRVPGSGCQRRHRSGQGDRSAMQNASPISVLLLTTEAMIGEIPEKKSAPAPGGEHGPGGMDY